MRQKYLISRNFKEKELKIVEYAVIDKDLKKVASEQLRNDNFSLLCKETYRSEIILNSIARGKAALIETLRTHNIFPISSYANEIAEKVKELYSLPEDGMAELFFNDVDLVSVKRNLD